MRLKLAVFDWNGTILSDTKAAWQAGNACLELFGVAPISLTRYRDTFDFPIIHFYARNGCSVDEVLAHKNETRTFEKLYEHLSRHARTRRGARDLLTALNARGVRCIVLSNYQTDKINTQLRRLQLDHFFTDVSAHQCDGSTILHSTNKRERLSAYMAEHGYEPGEAFIIGDSLEEPQIARHLGMTSIGITDGCVSRARLKKVRPDYTVHTLRDVMPILEEVFAMPDAVNP